MTPNARARALAATHLEAAQSGDRRAFDQLISPILDQASQPFVKGEHGAPASSGLGLAVVAAITNAHHGNLILDSTPTGTTVTLQLPTPNKDPAHEGEGPERTLA